MKRSPALQDLSREHHTALRLALHWRRTAESGEHARIEAACESLRTIFDDELLPHFREEEQWLLPRLEAAGAGAVVARTLIEHRTMQRLVRALEIPDGETLLRFARLLSDHVRFEERELFEIAEKLLGESGLAVRYGRTQQAGA